MSIAEREIAPEGVPPGAIPTDIQTADRLAGKPDTSAGHLARAKKLVDQALSAWNHGDWGEQSERAKDAVALLEACEEETTEVIQLRIRARGLEVSARNKLRKQGAVPGAHVAPPEVPVTPAPEVPAAADDTPHAPDRPAPAGCATCGRSAPEVEFQRGRGGSRHKTCNACQGERVRAARGAKHDAEVAGATLVTEEPETSAVQAVTTEDGEEMAVTPAPLEGCDCAPGTHRDGDPSCRSNVLPEGTCPQCCGDGLHPPYWIREEGFAGGPPCEACGGTGEIAQPGGTIADGDAAAAPRETRRKMGLYELIAHVRELAEADARRTPVEHARLHIRAAMEQVWSAVDHLQREDTPAAMSLARDAFGEHQALWGLLLPAGGA